MREIDATSRRGVNDDAVNDVGDQQVLRHRNVATGIRRYRIGDQEAADGKNHPQSRQAPVGYRP